MKHPFLKPWLLLALLAGMAALTPVRAATPGTAAAPKAPACAPLLQHSFLRLQDEKPQSLCQYGGKVLVVVNTASFCGFTRQYAGLEALYTRYRDQGLVVLGFPSNDFSQERGSNKEIADFCENTFGVKFPMFVKSGVSGPAAHPLFRQLAEKTGQPPHWNFHKYVVARDGQRVTSFNSATDPKDPAFLKDIEEKLLGK
ncbi:glutathione peroxidase [Polaromonas sp.]|jgi:glutathione peroxidase|uniref:glutathione peroxidase n=1 Tax=Polaromonas sp. TaxID=1869339 RepID=UPI0037C9972A